MKTHILLLALGVLVFAGCAKKESSPGGHDHAAHKHVHVAPHGGTLIELGEHAYNLELLRDPASGKITAWVLDGHAENFVRIPAPSFEMIATVAGAARPLTFIAVANAATDETVGNTSQFEAMADWLKTADAFDAVIPTLTIKGNVYTRVTFTVASAPVP